MNRRKVSVIMSVYNPKPFSQLETAARSILEQSERDWELLIYDDGSSEEWKERIKSLEMLDSRIRCLEGKENRGIAYGLNQCIQEAEGEYIARMDGDDISLPDRLKEQADFLDEHKEYEFVGCSAFLIGEDGVWGVREMPEIPKKESFLSSSPYIHPSVMFRKSVFEKHGYYHVSDETKRCEDYELFMRLHIFGCRGYNLQKKLFCYREDKGSYRKRRLCYRIDEIRLRRLGFAALGLNGAKAWMYRYKPLAVWMIPGIIYRGLKRCQAGGQAVLKERRQSGEYPYPCRDHQPGF